jgi:predicted metalloprotease with PDZ domain
VRVYVYNVFKMPIYIHICRMQIRNSVLGLFIALSMSLQAVNYTVSFSNVNRHYVSVEMVFKPHNRDYVDFKVPVWTPGSYKVREFSQNFEHVAAQNCNIERTNKNTWRIYHKNQDEIKLSYEVFCFTTSVRQSYADQYYAFLHGVSAFGYIEGLENEEIILEVKPLDSWKNVEVALPIKENTGFVFTSSNYDEFVDSPIAVGNFESSSYETMNVPHKIVMIGEGNYDLEKFTSDVKKITDWQAELMGEHPSKQYIHFIYNVDEGGGGLEHANCHTSMINRWSYTNKGRYRSFLGLVAHEYFHLWNVKRLRPIELGPFDYDKEVYTDLLWVAEGITSYYDDLTLYKLGFYTEKEYLNILASNIARYENTPGKDVMSLAESSRLAWVKSYLPTEESNNMTISYYNKGMVAALLLDLEIRKRGKKSLNDVMQDLYQTYYKKKNRGFTPEEFEACVNKAAGKDLGDWFDKVVYSTSPLDYSVLETFGIDLKESGSNKAYTGLNSKVASGKVVITDIVKNGPAQEAGLSVNDEIVAINGWRLNTDLENEVNKYKVKDKLEMVYVRSGKMYETELILSQNPYKKLALEVEIENKKLEAWLR